MTILLISKALEDQIWILTPSHFSWIQIWILNPTLKNIVNPESPLWNLDPNLMITGYSRWMYTGMAHIKESVAHGPANMALKAGTWLYCAYIRPPDLNREKTTSLHEFTLAWSFVQQKNKERKAAEERNTDRKRGRKQVTIVVIDQQTSDIYPLIYLGHTIIFLVLSPMAMLLNIAWRAAYAFVSIKRALAGPGIFMEARFGGRPTSHAVDNWQSIDSPQC